MSEHGAAGGPAHPAEVDVPAFAELLGPDTVVVDVREDDEYRGGHVPGAVSMPLATVPDRYTELPSDQPVYVVCAVGGRSAQAAHFLASAGLQAINVDGGTKGWVAAGHPVEVPDQA